ncbi:CAP domain-containing protein [Flavobacterium sp.]|uniref:CAP domain-containing protein n=1 Tax=Flavobacterium sp. TaxID=239 RepID=UPI00286DA48C|nr:CAP domain-containing protein [Flavobacterium sp.]
MKAKFTYLLLVVIPLIAILSCSSDSSKDPVIPPVIPIYNYNALELETMTLINNYRVSKGLIALKKSDYISYQAEAHNNYMIANNVIKHDNFSIRSASIVSVLGATFVAENLAFNVDSAQKVLDDWLASDDHKANIEGNFTHFGLSIRVNSDGKKYYTNIFAKI